MLSEPLPTDEELALHAQQGCRASFELLARRFQPPLLHFLKYRTGRLQDAEDLTQETLVRAFQNIDRYRPGWPFKTWLFTIARNLNINHHRRLRSRPALEALSPVESAEPQVVDVLSSREIHAQLWSIAERVLSEPQYAALWLHYVEDMSTRDVGRVVGHSRLTVKTILFRARAKLAPHLRQLDEADRWVGSAAQSAIHSSETRLRIAHAK